ncbi:MAG TPA: serine hydrolase [Verrucomicrobiae bacterium]|nr:serine hydrolase [Verrucomicrobiae bacterium]
MARNLTSLVAVFGLVIPAIAADDYPGETWARVSSLSQAGWSAKKLAAAREYSASIGSSAVMIVEDGLVVSEWGETSRKILIHSMRKSYMSALYGIYVANGRIRLSKTLAELGIDDNEPRLTAAEKQATIEDLLKARSGVYHPALEETASMEAARPQRGSHPPGTFWYYNNWDFNALGTIFEQETGRKIFEEVKRCLADPLQMQDFQVSDGRYDTGPLSIHRGYPMWMTARDNARFGLLYLREGVWRGRQVVPKDWVRRSITSYSNAHSHGGYGYLWWIAANGKHIPNVTLEDGAFSAEGVGGNYILVIPSRKLVIVHRVITANHHAVKSGDFGQLVAQILAAKAGAGGY